jgi:hypothetical protein
MGVTRWNILGVNFTKRDALSSLYKISMGQTKKLCFLAMFPEGGQTMKHCFLAMFPEGGQTSHVSRR